MKPDDVIGALQDLKGISMTFTLLQESELGKIVNQLKKIVKDHEKASALVNEILAEWKEIASKEAAARKRKREESAVNEDLSSPVPEKKSKLVEASQSSSGSQSSAASSSQAEAAGPKPLLSLPGASLRKDFANRLADSLKQISASLVGQQTKAALDTAILIEAAVFDAHKNTDDNYKEQLRHINYHLKQNLGLRERVALSQLDPAKVAVMSPGDLVSDEMKAEHARITEEVSAARKPIPLEPNCTTERCRKCSGTQIHVRQAQTRSSDEPMTQFYTCLNCKMKWKV